MAIGTGSIPTGFQRLRDFPLVTLGTINSLFSFGRIRCFEGGGALTRIRPPLLKLWRDFGVVTVLYTIAHTPAVPELSRVAIRKSLKEAAIGTKSRQSNALFFIKLTFFLDNLKILRALLTGKNIFYHLL